MFLSGRGKVKLHSERGYYVSQTLRASARKQRFALTFSLFAHFCVLSYLEYPLLFADDLEYEEESKPVVTILAPPPTAPELPETAAEPAIQSPPEIAQAAGTKPEPPPPPKVEIEADDSKVDPTHVTPEYKDPDPHSLPEVLRLYRGRIGFAKANDTEYLLYLFTADGNPIDLPEKMEAMENYLPIRIRGSGYQLVDGLRKKYHLEEMDAFALFSQSFHDNVYRSIRQAAAKRGDKGRVEYAVVVLSAASPTGIEVRDVRMAGQPR